MKIVFRNFIVGLLLFGVTLAVYWQVTHFAFLTYDDDIHVYGNPYVASGLSWPNIKWAFGIHGPSQWHPLAWLSHQLDCELFGMNPAGHHLVNVLLHAANAILLLTVLYRMTEAFWPSALVASLFALHPLHVESVAWISERRDVLSGLFLMLTLLSYHAYAKRGGLGRYLLVVACFALGLMSKPMLVTLPFALVLLDVWPLGRLRLTTADTPILARSASEGSSSSIAWLLAEKLPLLALSAVSAVLTILCQLKMRAIGSFELHSLPAQLGNAILSYVAYLRKMVWPDDLALFYPYRLEFVAWQVAAALLFLIAVSAGAIFFHRRRPYLAVGWFWYLGTLVPVIGLVQAGEQSMADRFTYIPMIGVYLMIAWGGADLLGRRPARLEIRFAAVALAAMVLAALMTCTWLQARHWRDSIALFQRALDTTSQNPIMHYNLGLALAEQGNHQQALEHYRQALRFHPKYTDAYNNLGIALHSQGKYDEAIRSYEQALELEPAYADAYCNLGIALASQGKIEEAIDRFRQAIQIKPDHAKFHLVLGLVLLQTGKLDEAITELSQAARLNPNLEAAQQALAAAKARQAQFGGGLRYP